MSLTLVIAPAIEPVTVEDAKDSLRVDVSTDDALIGFLIKAARRHAERYTSRALVEQTWNFKFGELPSKRAFYLPKGALRSVESFAYLDEDNSSTTIATTVYGVDTDGEKGVVYLKPAQSWPSATLWPHNAVTVQFKAGYGGFVENDAAESGTTTTAIKMTAHGLVTGDVIVNTTRFNAARTVTVVDADNVTVKAVTGQVDTDTIAKYDIGAVPEEIRQAILRHVDDMYRERGSVIVGQGFTAMPVPGLVGRLLYDYRLEWF